MKQTLITKKTDGYEVVRGVGRTVIDPIKARELLKRETPKTDEYNNYLDVQRKHRALQRGLLEKVVRKRQSMLGEKINAAVKNSPEYKNFQKVKATADKKTKAGLEAFTAAWNAYKKKEQEIYGRDSNVNAALMETAEYKELLKAREDANFEIKEAYRKLLLKRSEIVAAADIFFAPKAGEEIISEEEARKIRGRLKTLSKKTLLAKTDSGEDGYEEISDRRGDVYWEQDQHTGEWKERKVKFLGEELAPGIFFKEDLTREIRIEIAEQKEEARIDALNDEERRKEFDSYIKGCLREAANLKVENELAGMTAAKALTTAKNWLAEQKSQLAEKYGITEES